MCKKKNYKGSAEETFKIKTFFIAFRSFVMGITNNRSELNFEKLIGAHYSGILTFSFYTHIIMFYYSTSINSYNFIIVSIIPTKK